MKRQIVYSLLILMMFSQGALANGAARGPRPQSGVLASGQSGATNVFGGGATRTATDADAVRRQVAQRFTDRFVQSGQLRGREDQTMLIEAMIKSPEVRQEVEFLANITTSDTGTRELIAVRLALLPFVANIRPYDPAVQAEGRMNSAKQAEIDLALLILNVRGTGQSLSTQARQEMISFMKEVQQLMEGGMPNSEVLQQAAQLRATESGFVLDTTQIRDLVSSPDGVELLFKSASDARHVKITTSDGTVFEAYMSAREGEALQDQAWQTANDLMTLATNPQELVDRQTEAATASLRSGVNSASEFMKDNPVLARALDPNASAGLRDAMTGERSEVAKSIDELQTQLQQLGAIQGSKNLMANVSRWVRDNVPGASRIVQDPINARRSVLQRIQEIDRTIVEGAQRLEENNQTLFSLRAKANTEVARLQREIARLLMTTDYVQTLQRQAKESGQERLANTLAQEVLPILQRELNAAISVNAVLIASLEGINQIIRSNNGTIQSAQTLRTVTLPVLVVNETMRVTGEDLRATQIQQARIARFTEQQFAEMSKLIRENNERFARMSGESFISPETVERVLTELTNERVAHAKRMEEAARRQAANNAKLVQAVNRANALASDTMLGDAARARLNAETPATPGQQRR